MTTIIRDIMFKYVLVFGRMSCDRELTLHSIRKIFFMIFYNIDDTEISEMVLADIPSSMTFACWLRSPEK